MWCGKVGLFLADLREVKQPITMRNCKKKVTFLPILDQLSKLHAEKGGILLERSTLQTEFRFTYFSYLCFQFYHGPELQLKKFLLATGFDPMNLEITRLARYHSAIEPVDYGGNKTHTRSVCGLLITFCHGNG